ncbi:MAG: CpaF family protein [Clostridiales bacterium]|jgi:pilus assembly protein CpaF|nr:CpaF family protein [Clostridiales bacterium]
MMDEKYMEIRGELHSRIIRKIDFSREVKDEEILDLIDDEVIKDAPELNVSLEDMKHLRQDLFYSIRKLDVLQELIDDPTITEIMINGRDQIFVERDGRIGLYPAHFASEEKLEDVIQQVVSSCDRVVNASSPIVDARLANGARVNVVLPPIALNGPTVTIRRFPDEPIRMPTLLKLGALSEETVGFLKTIVCAGYNIFISGGTGSGKTTFLNALSDFIPEGERVITIEDNAELQIKHIPNLVRLEARNANNEGCAEVSIRDLIRSSLRMRPDRIIVGEVRGGEAIDMLQAMNTGHDGSMSTGHANSAHDMLSRLETMVLMGTVELPLAAIRAQIASGLDIIVHLGRLRDRSRKLLEIDEVCGISDGRIELRNLFCFEEEGEDENGKIIGCWKKKNSLSDCGKLRAAGIMGG